MSLQKYKQKRNFDKTTEPKGKIKKTKSNRFVIQYHQARAKHYDFRLEHNGVLLSWAVPKGLSNDPKQKRLAVMVEDHPVDYIDFEGIIPKGNYGAGTVEIFDNGKYMPLEDFSIGLKKGHIKFLLSGKKLKGAWSLIKTNDKNWLIVKIDDQFTKQEKPQKTKLPFKTCQVQLATLTEKIPNGKDWLFEIKYDGYRIVSYVENGKVKMLSRNNIDYTNKFASLKKSLQQIKEDNFIVDGEVVVFDKNGKTDFGMLQNNIKHKKNEFFYVIFDILALNGKDLRDLPLSERKAKLERLLYNADKNLIFSSHVSKGKQSFEFAKKNNLEGIVAKKASSHYLGKRNTDWLKIKCYKRQEFVIAGYTTSEKNEILSSLLLGYYSNKKLIYVGKVGTGFNELNKIKLHTMFVSHIRKTCPFDTIPTKDKCVWLKPKFVAEIQFAELTKEKLLRQPSFLGLRDDKNAKDVKLEY